MNSFVTSSEKLFALLEIQPSGHSRSQPRLTASKQHNPDAIIIDSIHALCATFRVPGQRLSVVRQSLTELESLGEFAIAALPHVALLCNHTSESVSAAAIETVRNLGIMAINGGETHRMASLTTALPSLTQAFGHASADIQKLALTAYGAMGVAAVQKGRSDLVTRFTDMSHISTMAFARKYVRMEAAEIREAILMAKAA